jgi:hypothetical protein
MVETRNYSKQPMPGKGSQVTRGAGEATFAQEKLCEELKRTYTVERRLLDERLGRNKGRPYSPSPRYAGEDTRQTIEDNKHKIENTWLKVVRELWPARIHPCIYVRTIFRGITGTTVAAPYPHQLLQKKWKKFFHKESERILESIPETFSRQSEFSTSYLLRSQRILGYNLQESVYYLLTDRLASLTPLYRYGLAMSMLREPNLSKIDRPELFQRTAGRLERSAVVQYTQFASQYDKYWGAILPDGFREKAASIYGGLLRVCLDEGDNFDGKTAVKADRS